MREKMLVLGITGGIGCGKSEAVRFLAGHADTAVCMADKIGAELQESGGAAYQLIVEAFGTEILNDDLSLNRARLGEIVFHHPRLLSILNDIVHPLVMDRVFDEMKAARDEGKRLFALESAILFEAGYGEYCDEVWYIRVPEETRIKRLATERGLSRERVQSIMARQMTDDEYMSNCDVTIDNTGDLHTLYAQLERELKRLMLS